MHGHMNYTEAIACIQGLQRFPEYSKLDHIRHILKELGNPEQDLQFVHVTGTNGKGSTCAMIESILRSSGYKVGLFISPHLFEYTERIQINRNPISKDEFAHLVTGVFEVIDRLIAQEERMQPGLFECFVILSLLYFKEKKVNWIVMEAGLGGTIDSTNVIDGSVAVITNIGLEHAEILGNSLEAIAENKSGIIKKKSIAITAEQNLKLVSIFQKKAKEEETDCIAIHASDIQNRSGDLNGQQFDYKTLKNLKLSLLGAFQPFNAACAIEAAWALHSKGFSISENAIREGLSDAAWPLRLQILHRHPTVLVDAGHNIHGVEAIVKDIKTLFKSGRKILVTGISEDKPYAEMVNLLVQGMDEIIITQAHYHAAPVDQISATLPEGISFYKIKNLREALEKAKALAQPEDHILVLGGLYLGSDAARIIPEVF